MHRTILRLSRLSTGACLGAAVLVFAGCNSQPNPHARHAIRASPDSGCDTSYCPIGAVDPLGLFVHGQNQPQVNAAPLGIREADPG